MAIKRRSSSRNSTKTSSSLAGSSSYENNNNNDGNNKQNKKQKVVVTAIIKRKSHWTRPGVEAAARLVSLFPPLSSSSFPSSLFSEQKITNDTVKSWNMALSCYTTMLKVKGGTKLYQLDQQRDGIGKQWKLNDNNNNNSNNSSKEEDEEEVSMTKDQLLNIIIPWKFLKGKPRNALKPLLQSNSEEDVIRCCKAAFQFADKLVDENKNTNDNNKKSNEQYIQESIQSICNLKGVGPATASAILSIYNPQHFCFMDDEIIECLYDKKRGYTLKIYMEVNERCAEIARMLNDCCSSGDEGGGKGGGEGNELWTPASVGKALWTVATMSAQNDEEGLNKVFNG